MQLRHSDHDAYFWGMSQPTGWRQRRERADPPQPLAAATDQAMPASAAVEICGAVVTS